MPEQKVELPIIMSSGDLEDYAVKMLFNGDANTVREKVTLHSVKGFKIEGDKFVRRERVLRTILAAAGPEVPPASTAQDALNFADKRYKEMTSPYSLPTRTLFTDLAHRNPILRKAFVNRAASFFKHGYTLELQLKSMTDEQGRPLKPEQAEARLEQERSTYQMHLKTLMDWSEKQEINCLDRMRTALIASVVQGRTLVMITPGIESLQQGQMPLSLKVIHTEDIGNPIVDTYLWKVAAVRLTNLDPVYLALPDQMVYIIRGDWGMRKESAFYGTADMEAVLTAAQVYMKTINYDLAKASVAAYLTKIMFAVAVPGMTEAQRRTYIDGVIAQLKKHGTDFVVVDQGVEPKAVPVSVDKDALEFIINKLEELLIASGGSTLSQMGKTQGLTRDNATIQEIAFVEYVRVPDEELIKTAFENDVFNKLLAHLAGKSFEEIPVKVVIVRKEPDKEGKGDVSYKDNDAESYDHRDGGQLDEEDSGSEQPVEESTDDGVDDDSGPDKRQRSLEGQKQEEIEGADKKDDKQAFKQKDAKRKPLGAAGSLTGDAILDFLNRSDPAKLHERAVRAVEKLGKKRVTGGREKYVRPGER